MKIKKALLVALMILGLCGISHAQSSLGQTTVSAAISIGPAGAASGLGSTTYQTLVTLASGTGVNLAINGQPTTFLYIDQELFGVVSNPTGTTYSVLRAQQGTKASAHASGTMVLIQTVSPTLGGFSGSGGLQPTDPPIGGACTAANTLVTPWVNIITSAQWLCSTITGTWVPGWNNPYGAPEAKVTTAVASAAGQVTPSGPLFHITGALAITGFLIPVGFNATAAGGGCFTVIPDGTFTWTTANNIAIAGTAVVNVLLSFCWDATNSKWVPSYVMA